VGTFGGHLPDVDLRVEVGGKGIAVVSRIAVQDVDIVDLVKIVLQRIGGEHTGHSRVKTASKKGCKACLLVGVPVGPLPFVLKFCRVLGLVVGRVHIVYAAGQAGVHDVK